MGEETNTVNPGLNGSSEMKITKQI